MARQKPVPHKIGNDEAIRSGDGDQSVSYQPKSEIDNMAKTELHECDSSESLYSTQSYSEGEGDDDIPDMTAEELCEQGKKLEEMHQLDAAVEYFEWAVRKKNIELAAKDDSELIELNPEMGEYWLRYGDALFTKLEATEDLFSVEKPVNEENDGENDDKKLAWECLDTARVCFDQMLGQKSFAQPKNERIDNMLSWLMSRSESGGQTNSPLWQLRVNDLDAKHLQLLKMIVYCRMRLGDFTMAFGQYNEAVEEFASALRICQSYGLEYSKGLEVALPMAQCIMAVQSPASILAFRTSLKLIEDEKQYENPSKERTILLDSTYEDLERQIVEYEATKERIGQEVQSAIEHVQGGRADEDEEANLAPSDITNLGVISKKRRKNDEPSTRG